MKIRPNPPILAAPLRVQSSRFLKIGDAPSIVTTVLLAAFPCCLLGAGPDTTTDASPVVRLKQALEGAPTTTAKFIILSKAMRETAVPDMRRKIVEVAVQIPGPEREAFIIEQLTADEDAGIRSQGATALGKWGSEKHLAALAWCAANDRTSDWQSGCIRMKSSARRAATFAIAELALRLPTCADEAVARLRALALPETGPAEDGENLTDARAQALYQLTHEAALLAPFHERLKSGDPGQRVRGVVAFRFLKLKEAPEDLIATIKDSNTEVCSTAAMVLGEIGDPKAIDGLMSIAGNVVEAAEVRCNAIGALGNMKVAAAAGLMEKLLADPEPSVSANAAIALYRITGRKVPQFPQGYGG